LIKHYGTKYGKLSYIINKAMKIYLKIETGILKIVKKSIPNKWNAIDDNMLNPFLEQIDLLHQKIENLQKQVESTQQILNIKRKSKKQYKTVSKIIKANTVINDLKKCNKHFFTRKEYEQVLIEHFGQADPRTINSDLKALKRAGIIKEGYRHALFGPKNFQFTENQLYNQYNSHKAIKIFVKNFKTKFTNRTQILTSELKTFIQKSEEIYNLKFVNNRLKSLNILNLISAHPANPKILNLHI